MTLSSLWRVFTTPDHAVYKPVSAPDEDWSHAAMLGCIHLYHMLRYSGLSAADWFHHLAFIPFNQLAVHWPSISTSWAAWGFKWGPIVNAQDFFVCGLPGALDYLMLALVKEGRMEKTQHKHYQAKVNVWLRAPGIVATCTLHFFGLMRVWSAPDTPFSAKLIGVLDVVLIGWNGLYYVSARAHRSPAACCLCRAPAGCSTGGLTSCALLLTTRPRVNADGAGGRGDLETHVHESRSRDWQGAGHRTHLQRERGRHWRLAHQPIRAAAGRGQHRRHSGQKGRVTRSCAP